MQHADLLLACLLSWNSVMNVFLSYANADEKLAKKVGAGLKRAGLRVRDYRREMLPSTPRSEIAQRALRESDAMVVLLSPDSARSEQVRSEINYALSNYTFKNRLIPVLVGPPERIPKSGVPWILWDFQMIKLPEHGNQDESIRQIARTLRIAA